LGSPSAPPSSTDRTSKQKINKGILELNNTMDKMNFTDIYRVVHPMTANYTFFSVAHRAFSKIDHILGHKANLNKYKNNKIIPCTLTDHNGLKLEINGKENSKNH
jgi:exonuclease III